MVFSIYSVCLAYVFGMLASTLYVRNLKLLGAGFFWMMFLIQISMLVIALALSDGVVKLLSFIALMLCSLVLSMTVAKRKQIKKGFGYPEKSLCMLIILILVFVLVFIANREVSQIDLLVESVRLLVGGLMLGLVTTAMLLGHWYLLQPGLTRKPISNMCLACIGVLIANILLWLLPTSMISVINGSISDGWGGTLGYMWIGSWVTTLFLLIVAYRALKEKSYSAVMATTGLLYLAILVANGVELIPRAIFS